MNDAREPSVRVSICGILVRILAGAASFVILAFGAMDFLMNVDLFGYGGRFAGLLAGIAGLLSICWSIGPSRLRQTLGVVAVACLICVRFERFLQFSLPMSEWEQGTWIAFIAIVATPPIIVLISLVAIRPNR